MNSSFFQNMAPNAQRAFFFTLALAAVATVLYLFAVQPATDALTKEEAKLDELQEKYRHVSLDLKDAADTKKKREAAEADIKPFRDILLTPLLESYALRARSILDPLVVGAGLTEADYAEDPFRPLPVPKSGVPRQLFTRAAIRVTVRGSYQSIVSFLMRLECEHPLIAVQSFDISAQNDPLNQLANIVLEWPAEGKVTRP